MHPWILAVVSVLLSVAAQFTLKAGMKGQADAALWKALLQPLVMGGFVLYGLSAVVWLAVLARWDVSKAYPLVGGGFVFTALIGFLIGEVVSIQRWMGIALICLGVVLVSKS
jgi:multidrug transporter EmrE-like cation transporter